MKKRSIIITAALILSLFTAFSAMAADYDRDVVVSLEMGNPMMQVNGIETEIDEGRGTMPMAIDGRTLVPIRAVIEAFGGNAAWNGDTQTVTLTMDGDTVILVIDSTVAYLNSDRHVLDVAPRAVNGRTMLPLRFIAESFNLGVAWDGDTQTVFVVRNSFDSAEYDRLMSALPEYSGSPYAVINNNIPFFEDYEIITGSFEYYSDLDELGRCDVCMASVARDIMPTGERESISSVTPTGWKNAYYDTVDGGYLYNRCHLIGYQLTGENANDRNLITGTRYMNVEGMLPFENMVDDYIEETGNRVMYRATPVFQGNNLVANGVLMEAYSVEDDGRGVSFCVYCYNVEPTVAIDYKTGANSSLGSNVPQQEENTSVNTAGGVYRTPTGKRYHFDSECGGENSYPVSLSEATDAGLTPCKKCAK